MDVDRANVMAEMHEMAAGAEDAYRTRIQAFAAARRVTIPVDNRGVFMVRFTAALYMTHSFLRHWSGLNYARNSTKTAAIVGHSFMEVPDSGNLSEMEDVMRMCPTIAKRAYAPNFYPRLGWHWWISGTRRSHNPLALGDTMMKSVYSSTLNYARKSSLTWTV